MAGNIKGITIEIGGNTQPLNKALESVNKQTKDLQSELKQVERLLKLDPGNTELLAQKQKLLAESIEQTKTKLETLREAQRQVEEQFAKGEIGEQQYRALQREVVATEQKLESLEKQLKDMEPAVESLSQKLEKAGEKMKTAGDKMSDAGKKLSVGVTAPIAAVGTVAAKSSIEFESAFAGVRKTVDATEEEFAELSQGIRDMSKQMPAAATEIAAVAEAAGQLGIETPNILKFTEVMIGLGEATNLTAEQGATEFARFANIVGMSQQNFDRLGSSVVALGNNLATTEAEIVSMGMRLAGQGAQIKMTEAQIMALAAAMSSVGIEAEAGGTAMSTTLKKMQNAVSLGGDALDRFAKVARMSADEFANAFKNDPMAALQAFIDGLAKSSAEGENLTLILDDLSISGIRESDTLLRLAGANDVLRSAVEISTKAWEENTALQNEVAQRYATTKSKLSMLKNKVTDIAITLGDALVPALMSVLQAADPIIGVIAAMAQSFANLEPGTQKIILAVVAFVAALGPLLVIIGKVVGAIGTILTTLPAVAGAFTAAGGVAGVFGSAVAALTGPIGIAIAAITALIAAGVAIYKNWDEIKAWASDLGEKISETWQSIKEKTTETWQGIKETIVSRIETIAQIISETWNSIRSAITEVLTRIYEVISSVWTKIKDFLEPLWTALKLLAEIIFFAIVIVIQKTSETVREILETVWNAIKFFLEPLWEGLKSFAETIFNALKTAIETATNAAKTVLETVWNAIKAFLEPLWNELKTVAVTVFNAIKEAISTAFTNTKTAIEEIWTKIKEWINETWESIKAIFTNSYEALKNIGYEMFNSMWEGMKSIWTGISNWVTEKVNWILEKLQAWRNALAAMAGFGGGGNSGGGTVAVGANWTGTPYWRGGLTTLHELGYELYDLPSGTRIYNHEASEDLVIKTAEAVAKKIVDSYASQQRVSGIEVTQHIYAPTPSPSEVARQTRKSLQRLALEM